MLSTPTTASARASRRWQTWLPMKPAAPVTRMVMRGPLMRAGAGSFPARAFLGTRRRARPVPAIAFTMRGLGAGNIGERAVRFEIDARQHLGEHARRHHLQTGDHQEEAGKPHRS